MLFSMPCKIYLNWFTWHIIQKILFLYPYPLCCTCLYHVTFKWDAISSKFQCRSESLIGKACNGEALRWDLSSMLVKKACWLASSYTQMDGVSRESHTHWSEAPLPSHSGRKWDWTRGGRARKGVNHRTNAALHHRFLSPPAHPHCQCLTVYTAPPAFSLS